VDEGPNINITATTTGLTGEYITAAALLGLGWRVSMSQQDSVDLVAWSGQDFMRVQVKSAQIHKQRDRAIGYQFQNASGRDKKTLPTLEQFDVLAHCAINDRKVHFTAACSVNQYTQRRPPSWFHQDDLEQRSWEKAVQIVMETRNG
jgi:hypothetical protein